jgi:hypothetical protein
MDGGFSSQPEFAAQFGLTVPSGFGYDFAGVIDEAGSTLPVAGRAAAAAALQDYGLQV